MDPAKTPLISIGPRVRKSPYFEATLRYGATAFTIYNHTYMPASYGDNVRDYWSLVNDVTLWDVACQRQVEITGPDAFEFVQFLTPRDMSRCAVGQCQYMVLTNHAGGIVNDAVLLRVEEAWPGGPGLLGTFGMDGITSLLWAYRLGRDRCDLLARPGFVMADLQIGTIPERPTDLRWCEDWTIQVILRLPL